MRKSTHSIGGRERREAWDGSSEGSRAGESFQIPSDTRLCIIYHTHTHTQTRIYACTQTHTYAHTHIRTNTPTHTHTQVPGGNPSLCRRRAGSGCWVYVGSLWCYYSTTSPRWSPCPLNAPEWEWRLFSLHHRVSEWTYIRVCHTHCWAGWPQASPGERHEMCYKAQVLNEVYWFIYYFSYLLNEKLHCTLVPSLPPPSFFLSLSLFICGCVTLCILALDEIRVCMNYILLYESNFFQMFFRLVVMCSSILRWWPAAVKAPSSTSVCPIKLRWRTVLGWGEKKYDFDLLKSKENADAMIIKHMCINTVHKEDNTWIGRQEGEEEVQGVFVYRSSYQAVWSYPYQQIKKYSSTMMFLRALLDRCGYELFPRNRPRPPSEMEALVEWMIGENTKLAEQHPEYRMTRDVVVVVKFLATMEVCTFI